MYCPYCNGIPLYIYWSKPDAFVTLPVVTKTLNKSNVRKEGFLLTHSSIIHGGEGMGGRNIM